MFERFTDRARRVLVLAQEEARLLDHGFIGTEHLLLGLIHEGDGLAAKALESLDISLDAVRQKVQDMIGPAGSVLTGSPAFTPRAKKVLELSLREGLQLGHNYIGTEHMLLGLVREGEGVAAQVLKSLGADLPRLRQKVIQLISDYQGRDQTAPTSRFADDRAVEWPRHPTKAIGGPTARLGSDGVEFRVIGLMVFPEGVEVLWRISGIPPAIADLLGGPVRISRGLLSGPSDAYVTVSDDRGTAYAAAGSSVAAQSDGTWAGNTSFTPSIPASAGILRVHWQGDVIEIDLGNSN